MSSFHNSDLRPQPQAPGDPWPAYALPPAEPKRSRRIWGALAVLPVLALWVFIGFTVATGKGNGGTSGEGAKARLLWWLDQKAIYGPEKGTPSTWSTGESLVLAGNGTVTGYDAATGASKWSIPLPGELCGASARPVKEQIAVLAGSGRFCDRLIVIDLADGSKTWSRSVPAKTPSRDEQDKTEEVVIGDGAVVVDRYGEGTAAFRLADGKPLWHMEGLAKNCGLIEIGGGKALLASQVCGQGAGAVWTVHRLDPKTGRSRWAYAIPEGRSLSGFFSSAPTVIGLGKGRTDRVVILDDAGRERARIPLGSGANVNCDLSEVTWCRGVVVTESALYLQTAAGDFSPVSITAYDLATGRRTWSTAGSSRAAIIPVGFEDGRLIAAYPSASPRKRGYPASPNRVVAIDPSSGKLSELMYVPASFTGIDELITYDGHLSYAGGRFVIVRRYRPSERGPGIAVFGTTPARQAVTATPSGTPAPSHTPAPSRTPARSKAPA